MLPRLLDLGGGNHWDDAHDSSEMGLADLLYCRGDRMGRPVKAGLQLDEFRPRGLGARFYAITSSLVFARPFARPHL